MKNLTGKLLLLFCLALVSTVNLADNRSEARNYSPTAGSGHWRLGKFLGGARGYEILYQGPGHHGWQVAPGAAIAVADGWVLGTDRHNGGYGIYRWNGYKWDRAPGVAVRIGGSYQQPWVENDRGIHYEWNGYDWRQEQRYSSRDNNYRNDKDRNNHNYRPDNSRFNFNSFQKQDNNRGKSSRNRNYR